MRGSYALLVLALLAACAAPPAVSEPAAEDWAAVYFTDPDSEGAGSVRGGPDEDLAAALDAARLSIDMAIYDLDLWSIRDALLAAHERGVPVRLVVESDNAGGAELSQLAAAGIPLVADTSPNFMHHKFVVIDGYEVWSGSSNFTVGDMYGNRNNVIVLRSELLAQDYTAEFDEMFSYSLFGEASRADTPHPLIALGDSRVEIYFSPDDGVRDRLVALIGAAQHSVRFLAFTFTSDELAEALAQTQRRGAQIAGVMDEGQLNNTGGEFDFFRESGIDVRIDPPGSNLHDKVLIIDEAIVVTGSYNFSNNAEYRNDENVLVIYDSQLAQQYLNHFEEVWSLTQP
jgi:phosphatidylserine/phosphatidylglycerophosphate/cardiolipin synthase-like enzyme